MQPSAFSITMIGPSKCEISMRADQWFINGGGVGGKGAPLPPNQGQIWTAVQSKDKKLLATKKLGVQTVKSLRM